MLHRQRERFIAAMKKEVVTVPEQTNDDEPAAQEQEQPTLNDEWLQSAIAKVEAHLNDDSYTVEQLASDLCMSRMTFYRKIQSATGQKPTEFMRTIRLRRAAELLREGRQNVTEISYATGFTSVSYFSRCFRTMYGVPPTQFGKVTTADDRVPIENPN
jgi:transcriptional regulator GlxA family with amidase domain